MAREQPPGRAILDALGDDLEAEAVGEIDRRSHDDLVRGSRAQVAHEGLVDLELVDRQGLELGEGGVTGSEIVDRDADAECSDAFEDGRRLLRISHHGALRHLELQASRRGARSHEDLGEAIGKIVLRRIVGREVHAHDEIEAALGPSRHARRRFFERPGGDAADQAGLLGDLDELLRVHPTEGLVGPADQGLGSDDALARDVDLGLGVELEVTTVEGALELDQDADASMIGLFEPDLVARRRIGA